MARTRLELTWANKDKALIPAEHGCYGYTWVDPRDPRYCEVRPLVFGEQVTGIQSLEDVHSAYTDRAELDPQTDNLLIHGESGDVLEALTQVPELAEKYVGEVKCIYIDPPFNTAQTFAHYEDNLEHSIWLTMMRDRLLHLRKLLARDGSIWVHLDDVEVHRMRVLMDEVFGAGNFMAEVVWQKSDSPRSDSKGFSADHDTLLVYGRDAGATLNRMPRSEAENSRFTNPDDDPSGRWFSDNRTAPGAATHQGMVYAIQHPVTGELIYPAQGRHWTFSQSDIFNALREWADYELRDIHDEAKRGELCGISVDAVRSPVSAIMLAADLEESARTYRQRKEQGAWTVFYITDTSFGRKSYIPSSGQPPRTWWANSEVGHNREAKSEIKALFPGQNPFTTPKPERLLERVIHIASNPGDIVLDVFAGSGTTAAVAQKMGRRWVTCELIEDTMDRFTRPRLEKVVNGQDPGGITSVVGGRVAADEIVLPEGMSAEEAQTFTSLLNKVIKDNPDGLKASTAVKQLKALTKTTKAKSALNWRGGGGFTAATLAPPVFDYDPALNLVTLTEHATGETLVRSVAANLGFRLTLNHPYFDGVKNSMRLAVIEGTLTERIALDLASHLAKDEGLTIAAPGREDGVQATLRRSARGVRVLHIPDDLFRHHDTEGITIAEETIA